MRESDKDTVVTLLSSTYCQLYEYLEILGSVVTLHYPIIYPR